MVLLKLLHSESGIVDRGLSTLSADSGAHNATADSPANCTALGKKLSFCSQCDRVRFTVLHTHIDLML